MKALLLLLALIVSAVGISQNAKADERHYYDHSDYDWDHEYWHHHHYGHWHHHRGYWRFRHGEHIFIYIDLVYGLTYNSDVANCSQTVALKMGRWLVRSGAGDG